MGYLLLYDGQCQFCISAMCCLKRWLGNRLSFQSYQSFMVHQNHPKSHLFSKRLHLISTSDSSTSYQAGPSWSGAAAVFKALSLAKWGRGLWWLYVHSTVFKWFTEMVYQAISETRGWLSSWWATGSFRQSTNIFLTGISIVYCLAFGSLVSQILLLFGQSGIYPIQSVVRYFLDASNPIETLFLKLPSILWWFNSDGVLQGMVIVGLISAVLCVCLHSFRRFGLVLCWFIYLSVVVLGHPFMSFQWDVLLLEMGVLAFWMSWFPNSRGIRFLLRWVLFRVLFGSGMVKLMSQDQSWQSFSALQYHFWTQPLPHLGSFFAHQLSSGIHRILLFGMFLIELVVPFFIFFTSRFRQIAFFSINGLMIAIMMTGNYGFFNILVMVNSIVLLNDHAIDRLRLFFKRRTDIMPNYSCSPTSDLIYEPIITTVSSRKWRWRFIASKMIGGLNIVSMTALFVLSFPLDLNRFLPKMAQIELGSRGVSIARSWCLVNRYGLFSVMTTTRPELVFQGSKDGVRWKTYHFKWKTNDVFRRPQWAFPYHPRLDWQLWFAALGTFESNRWLMGVLNGLATNHPRLIGALHDNPFLDDPPHYLRIMRQNYTFTSLSEWWKTGQYWLGGKLEPFSPEFNIRINPF